MNVKIIQLEKMELRCSNCGAVLKYSPTDKTVVCPNCGTKNEIDFKQEDFGKAWEEKDLLEYLEKTDSQEVNENGLTVKCAACGAEVEFVTPVIATECPYCASPIVLDIDQIPRKIKPQGIVPFTITREQARDQYRQWAKKKWFARSDFRKYANAPRSLKAEYVPYWTYDAVTFTDYRGERGDYYYETETYYENGEQKTRQVRRIRWTPVRGTVRVDFDDILVPATTQVSYLPKPDSWNISEMKPYEPRLLSGFYSKVYDISLRQGFEAAKQVMDSSIRSAIRRDIGGDEQRIDSYTVHYSDLTFKHILLPMYHSVYKFKGKEYPFAINGQTGKVYGKYPVSIWKILLVVLLVLLTLFLIYIWSEYDFNFTAFWKENFSQLFSCFFLEKTFYL